MNNQSLNQQVNQRKKLKLKKAVKSILIQFQQTELNI